MNDPSETVLLLGPRQSGKHSLLKEAIGKEAVTWIHGDSFRTCNQPRIESDEEADALLNSSKVVVLEEAQRISDASEKIRILMNRNIQKDWGTKILVTASSTSGLWEGKDEQTFGSIKIHRLWPLSIRELAHHISWREAEERLGSLMVFGMFPWVLSDLREARAKLLDYLSNVLFEDIFASSIVRKPEKLMHLTHLLAQQTACEINYDSLARDVKVSKNTVISYLDLLEKSFIIKLCPSFALGNDPGLKKGKKVYFVDNGIRNGILGNFDSFFNRPDAPALFENFAFMERFKFNDFQNPYHESYFWRAYSEGGMKRSGVDFLEVKDGKPHLAFECRLKEEKPSPTSTRRFKENFPECPVNIVTPKNIRKFLEPTRSLQPTN